jgi:CMP-N-acetylneuraminic acid synthetase
MICAIVPARGGSKGVPRKNLRAVGGRTLVARAIESARGASLVDRVIVSTDDEEIARVARQEGAEVPFLRPASLASDEAPAQPVLVHAVAGIEAAGGLVDTVVLLQPTSPLRRALHVNEAVHLFLHSGVDSVVSVCEVEHNPYWMYRMEGECLRPFTPDHELNRARRQDLPTFYRPNGAIYVMSRKLLMEDHLVIGNAPRPYLMSRRDSIDIDDELDLELAEWLSSRSTPLA